MLSRLFFSQLQIVNQSILSIYPYYLRSTYPQFALPILLVGSGTALANGLGTESLGGDCAAWDTDEHLHPSHLSLKEAPLLGLSIAGWDIVKTMCLNQRCGMPTRHEGTRHLRFVRQLVFVGPRLKAWLCRAKKSVSRRFPWAAACSRLPGEAGAVPQGRIVLQHFQTGWSINHAILN